MVVAEVPRRSLIQEESPELQAFLRFFGTVCSIPTVARFGVALEGGLIHCWVHLNDDDDDGQNAVYDAFRRFVASEHTRPASAELHVAFADEDESAFPPEAKIYFIRE